MDRPPSGVPADPNTRPHENSYWDGEAEPSVEVPVSDFFGMGFGEWKDFVSAPLNMTPAAGARSRNLGGSVVIIIAKHSGEVVYHGSARDEG